MQMTFAKLVLTLALPWALASCTTMTAGGATKAAVCDQFRPIRWSKSDTPETIRQAKEANAVGAAICNWKP